MPRKLSRPEKMENESIVKKRNWAFILYPDSAPENWKELLQKTGLQCAVSPLHDKDVNEESQVKKPHYHVILTYSGPTSYNVVEKITIDKLNSARPEPVEQIKGMYEYLTHKNDPDKYQYSEEDITIINGFEIKDFVELSKSEVNKLKMQITDYIEENDIQEYRDLLHELKANKLYDMWEVAANNTIFANAYCKSRRHKMEKYNPPKSSNRGLSTGDLPSGGIEAEKDKDDI